MKFTARANFEWIETNNRIHLWINDVIVGFLIFDDKHKDSYDRYGCLESEGGNESTYFGESSNLGEATKQLLKDLEISL